MIPERMEAFLKERLSEKTWQNRLIERGDLRYMEFNPLDIDRLARLGIEVDNLGPRLVVCMWDDASPLEIGGYLVVDNLAMGSPSMGGTRMLPDVTPSTIHNLARGMTLKNAAADLPYGGGKSGIVAERSLTPQQHTEVVRGFAKLIYPYRDIYLPGPDVGTNDADMKTVAIENGVDSAVSKPIDMGGNRIDQLGAAAGGTIIALEELIEQLPRLAALPQFAGLKKSDLEDITVLIQGFGAVGAHAARILCERIPGARVVGISDALGYLYEATGLPIDQLFNLWQEKGMVTLPYYQQYIQPPTGVRFYKYSNAPNDLLRESGFCLIPAAPIANYLDIDTTTQPAMTVNQMGDWWLIIEGANTYSPDSKRKAARARMERSVYRERGVLIATDYLVNSGGVIYAAQERLIKTPENLRIPESFLGDRDAVDKWLQDHTREFAELAEKRRRAGRQKRDEVIRRNMQEFVDLLLTDTDMLPSDAAEIISIRRIASSESDKTASEIMIPIPSISMESSLKETAELLIDHKCPIIAVLNDDDSLAGVVTEWDVTQAASKGMAGNIPVRQIMSADVISAQLSDNLIEVIRKLEYHEISAMPVVDDDCVLGMISSDLLARESLLRLLQSSIAA